PLPVANTPLPYSLCDFDEGPEDPGVERERFDLTTRIPEITGGANGVNVTFHTDFNEAQLGNNAITTPTDYTNLTTVQTLFVRVTDEATGCYRVVLLDIRVEPLPILVVPDSGDLTVCDPDGDGFGVIDLDALVADMVNNGVGLTVSFFETAENAENNVDPIPNTSAFPTVVGVAQTIYVRVENTATGCVTTAIPLNLVVVPSPQMPELEAITLCDEDNQNQNGVTVVDLTQQNAVIYAAPGIGANYVIHYFTSEANAQNGAPRITNPTTYSGTNQQVIWVRAEDPASECFGITSFILEIGTPHQLIQPAQYSVCNEVESSDDNQTVFDLTTRDNEILGPFGVGQGYTVEYFESQADMDNNNPITNPATYTNPPTQNPKTLFVRVTTQEGCRSYTTLTVKVMPLPTPNLNPTPLELCDDNNSPDGIEEFDLTAADAQIRNNNNTWVLTYHETMEDAEAGTNAIAVATAYPSGNGFVYVRVETRSGNPADAICHRVVTLELIVNPLPVLGTAGVIAPFAFCEQNTDGFNQFLLTDHIDEILVGLNPADYTVRFYLDQTNMNAGIALPNQYTNQTAFDQTILVRVENNETGCRSTGNVRLLVEEGAIANPVTATELSTCDTEGDNDGIATFDLTPAGAEALGTQSATDYSVAYYTSEAEAQAGINAIADPTAYTNTASPDVFTIWIRVTNTTTVSGCFDITSFTTLVEQKPEPVISTVEPGNTICVDAAGNFISGRELTTNINEAGYTYQWYINGTAINGATAANYLARQEGNYTVEVTSPAPLSCESDMSPVFEVIKSGPATQIGNGYTVSNYFSDNQVVTIRVEGFGIYEFKMDNGPWQTSNVFTNVTPGSHEVQVRDTQAEGEGCGTITVGGVSIVDYPKFFTPNGDGFHDTWKIIGLGDQAATSNVYIFDRYGKLIKQISTGGEGWDGTFNGTPMPATDYWFTISYEEDGIQKEFKAHFALKR
ncbi:MAG: T9SS type B sorting domain-containing protein, partial [Chitinophagaceae bacterium]